MITYTHCVDDKDDLATWRETEQLVSQSKKPPRNRMLVYLTKKPKYNLEIWDINKFIHLGLKIKRNAKNTNRIMGQSHQK